MSLCECILESKVLMEYLALIFRLSIVYCVLRMEVQCVLVGLEGCIYAVYYFIYLYRICMKIAFEQSHCDYSGLMLMQFHVILLVKNQ